VKSNKCAVEDVVCKVQISITTYGLACEFIGQLINDIFSTVV